MHDEDTNSTITKQKPMPTIIWYKLDTTIRRPTGARAVYREHVQTGSAAQKASYAECTMGQNGRSVKPTTSFHLHFWLLEPSSSFKRMRTFWKKGGRAAGTPFYTKVVTITSILTAWT